MNEQRLTNEDKLDIIWIFKKKDLEEAVPGVLNVFPVAYKSVPGIRYLSKIYKG